MARFDSAPAPLVQATGFLPPDPHRDRDEHQRHDLLVDEATDAAPGEAADLDEQRRQDDRILPSG